MSGRVIYISRHQKSPIRDILVMDRSLKSRLLRMLKWQHQREWRSSTVEDHYIHMPRLQVHRWNNQRIWQSLQININNALQETSLTQNSSTWSRKVTRIPSRTSVYIIDTGWTWTKKKTFLELKVEMLSKLPPPIQRAARAEEQEARCRQWSTRTYRMKEYSPPNRLMDSISASQAPHKRLLWPRILALSNLEKRM